MTLIFSNYEFIQELSGNSERAKQMLLALADSTNGPKTHSTEQISARVSTSDRSSNKQLHPPLQCNFWANIWKYDINVILHIDRFCTTCPACSDPPLIPQFSCWSLMSSRRVSGREKREMMSALQADSKIREKLTADIYSSAHWK